MDYRTATVDIADIDTEDRSFRISTRNRIDDLTPSLRAIGMIHPPIVLPNTDGRLTIVSGFTRVAAWQRLGHSSLRVSILENHPPRVDAARLAVAEIVAERELNVIEQARAYRLLRSCSPTGSDFRTACESIGLPTNRKLIEQLDRIASMPEYLVGPVISDHLSVTAALQLSELPPAAGRRLAEIFIDLRPGVNKQKELLTHITEIASRENVAIDDLLNENDVRVLIDGESDDRAARLARFRSYLKRRRFPELSRAEAEFNAIVAELSLPPTMKLMPPKFFEGEQFTLSILFSDRGELETVRHRLNEMIDHPVLERILT